MVLLKTISGLGTAGDVITTSAGNARNSLYPKGLAVYATNENIVKYCSTQEIRNGLKIAGLLSKKEI